MFIKDFHQIENIKEVILFWTLIVIYTSVLLFLSASINISEDESYSLITTGHNLSEVFSLSYNFEGQPPVYFIVLAFWRLIFSTIFFSRLLSIVFILLAAYFLYRLIIHYYNHNIARWIVLIFLVNPYSMEMATTIRTYALLIFLSSAGIYTFAMYYTKGKSSYILFFLGISIIGLYTQYFYGFVIFSLAVTVLVFKGWSEFIKLCFYLIIVFIFFIPNLFFISSQYDMAVAERVDYQLYNVILEILRAPQNLVLGFTVKAFSDGSRWIIRLVFLSLFIYGYYRVYLKRGTNPISFNILNALLVSITILMILYLIMIPLSNIWYGIRYFAPAFPFFILLFLFFSQIQIKIRYFLYPAFFFYFLFLIAKDYIFTEKIRSFDYISVTNFIEEFEQPDEPIVFYSNLLSLAFNQYYNGINDFIPLPSKVELNESYISGLQNKAEIESAFESLDSLKVSSFIIVTDDARRYSMNINMQRDIFNKYLKEHYIIEFDTTFYGLTETNQLKVRHVMRDPTKALTN